LRRVRAGTQRVTPKTRGKDSWRRLTAKEQDRGDNADAEADTRVNDQVGDLRTVSGVRGTKREAGEAGKQEKQEKQAEGAAT
jgi:hypothetical protein